MDSSLKSHAFRVVEFEALADVVGDAGGELIAAVRRSLGAIVLDTIADMPQQGIHDGTDV